MSSLKQMFKGINQLCGNENDEQEIDKTCDNCKYHPYSIEDDSNNICSNCDNDYSNWKNVKTK